MHGVDKEEDDDTHGDWDNDDMTKTDSFCGRCTTTELGFSSACSSAFAFNVSFFLRPLRKNKLLLFFMALMLDITWPSIRECSWWASVFSCNWPLLLISACRLRLRPFKFRLCKVFRWNMTNNQYTAPHNWTGPVLFTYQPWYFSLSCWSYIPLDSL